MSPWSQLLALCKPLAAAAAAAAVAVRMWMWMWMSEVQSSKREVANSYLSRQSGNTTSLRKTIIQ